MDAVHKSKDKIKQSFPRQFMMLMMLAGLRLNTVLTDTSNNDDG